MSMIENEEILKSPEHGKKIKSALNRIEKALKEITDLDYTIYVSAHGSINVMNTDDVPFKHDLDYCIAGAKDVASVLGSLDMDGTLGTQNQQNILTKNDKSQQNVVERDQIVSKTCKIDM